jgi:hypothetical protein
VPQEAESCPDYQSSLPWSDAPGTSGEGDERVVVPPVLDPHLERVAPLLVVADVTRLGAQDCERRFQHQVYVVRHVGAVLAVLGNQIVVLHHRIAPGDPEVHIVILAR